MLPRRHRLNRPDQFRAVVRSGARSGGRHVVVQVRAARPATAPEDAGVSPCTQPTRVGFVVGRSVGPAVVRNRVCRRLRAHVATRLPDLPEGMDIVMRALPSAATAPFAELTSDADRCLTRALAKVGQLGGTASWGVP